MDYKKRIEDLTVEGLQKVLSDGNHIASGNLYKSITASARIEENKIIVDIFGLKYGIFVDKGTRPHWAPITPIQQWCAIKASVPDTPGIAYAIQKTIARKGTKKYNIINKIPTTRIKEVATDLFINEIDINKWKL